MVLNNSQMSEPIAKNAPKHSPTHPIFSDKKNPNGKNQYDAQLYCKKRSNDTFANKTENENKARTIKLQHLFDEFLERQSPMRNLVFHFINIWLNIIFLTLKCF